MQNLFQISFYFFLEVSSLSYIWTILIIHLNRKSVGQFSLSHEPILEKKKYPSHNNIRCLIGVDVLVFPSGTFYLFSFVEARNRLHMEHYREADGCISNDKRELIEFLKLFQLSPLYSSTKR
jgi:hypothetical protein